MYLVLFITAIFFSASHALAATPSNVQLVTNTSTANATTVTITVASTGNKNLLVVGTANNATRSVTGVSDGTNSFTKVGQSDICNGVNCTELWYLPKSSSGKTSITITFSGAAGTFTKTGFFYEESGMLSPKPVRTQTNSGSANAPIIANSGYDFNYYLQGGLAVGAVIVDSATVGYGVNQGCCFDSLVSSDSTAASTRISNNGGGGTGGPQYDIVATKNYAETFTQFVDAPAGVVNFTQQQVVNTTVTNTITIPATTAGNLLVVGATNNLARNISSVSDGTNTYTQATSGQGTNGNQKSDLWYVLSTAGGITSITVTYSGAAGSTITKDVFVWEVTGLRSPAFDMANTATGVSSGDHTGASVTNTASGFAAGVISTNTGTVYCPGYGASNEFMAAGWSTGTEVAAGCSALTTTIGAHAPVYPEWGGGAKTFASSTAIFKETAPYVSQVTVTSDGGSPYVGNMSSTGAGNLIVVGVMNDNNRMVTAITDGTNSFTYATGSTVALSGGYNAEFWYLPSSTAGKTSVTITMTGTTNADIYIWEVSGVKNGVLETANTLTNSATGTTDTGPSVTTTSSPGFLAAMDMSISAVNQSPGIGSDFESGFIYNGNGVSHLYTSAPGTYTPTWGDSAGNVFSATTVAFKVGKDCGNPQADKGTIHYFPTTGRLKYCSSTGWVETSWSRGSTCAAGSAGMFRYNSASYEYCDGTNWIGMKGSSLGSCAGDTPGRLTFDSVSDKLKFCDGTTWYQAGGSTYCSSSITSGKVYAVPANFNNSFNAVWVLGAGGGGSGNSSSAGGAGGGGGAFTKVFNVSLTPSTSVSVNIGTAGAVSAAGGDTYFCNAGTSTNCNSMAGSAVIAGAKGGGGGAGATIGAGGLASLAVATPPAGAISFNGGSGRTNATTVGGGGGGAAGPSGVGVTPTGQAGGAGNNSLGGAGGTANNAGTAGTEWNGTVGSGGGGSGGSAATGKAGGNYGGGGGGAASGASRAAGAGKAGLIFIEYFGASCL